VKKFVFCLLLLNITIGKLIGQTWTVTPSGCPGGAVLEKIIVDACESEEGWNEFVTFTNGSSATNVNTIDMTGTTNGPPTSMNFTADAGLTNYLNNLASPACSPAVFVNPVGGVIPAGAKVIAFVSNHNPTFNQNLNSLCGQGPIYVVSGNYTSSNGFFLNNCSGGPCPKTIIIKIGNCTYSVVYDPNTFPVSDGSNVSLNIGGTTSNNSGNNDCFPTISCTPPPVNMVLGSATGICSNVPKSINPGLSNTQIAGGTYNWSGPSGFTSSLFNPPATSFTLPAGVYTFSVTVTNATGCSATASQDITVDSSPTFTAIPDLTVCSTFAVPLSVVGTPPPSGGATYLWSGAGLSSTTSATPTATAPAPTLPTTSITTTYGVTVTEANGCKWVDAFNITALTAPAIPNVINPVNICSGQRIDLTVTGGTVNTAFGLITIPNAFIPKLPFLVQFTWNGPNGFNSVTQADTPPHIVSVTTAQAPTLAGSYVYTLNTIVVGLSHVSCQSPPANVTVNVQTPSAPTVNTATVCNGFFINLNTLITTNPVPAGTWSGTGVTGGQIFNSNTLSAGSYSVTFTPSVGVCALPASTTITVAPAMNITDTQNGSLCGNSSPYTGSVSLSVTSGFFAYSWNTGSSSNTIAVNNPGTYSVTVTNSFGCSSVRTFNVSASPSPNVAITAPAVLCNGKNTTLTLNGTFDNYLWNNNSSGNTLNISSPGTYSVTVSYASGCSAVDSKTIAAGTALSPVILPYGKICGTGNVALTLSSTFSSYQWSNSGNTQTINVSSGGLYTVTVADNTTGCSGTASANVQQFAAPSVTINGTSTVCANTNNLLSTTPSTFSAYLWSNNSNSSTINPSNPSTYSVTVTDNNGCTAFNSFSFSNHPSITPIINGNALVCSGKTVSLNVSGGAFSAFQWSGGQTTNPASFGQGTHSVTVTDANGCKTSASKTITEDVINSNITGTGNVCQGKTTTLGVANSFSNYIWSNGASTPTITVGTGNYIVTVTNSNGCTAVLNGQIKQFNQPIVTITGNASYCAGSVNTISASPIFNTYLWSTGANTQNINVSGTATYSVTITDFNGCTATANKNITENPNPKPTISGSTSICAGSSTTLDAGAGFIAYLWSNNATTKSININQIGNYAVTVTDSNGCKGTTSQNITQNANLVFSIAGSPSFCEGKSTTLDAGSGFTTYLWDNGATTQSINANQAKTYSVTVSNGSCTGSATITISKNTVVPFTLTGKTDFCEGASTTFSTSEPFSNYLWSNNDLNQSITINQSGNYSVTVTDANGCTATQSITAKVNQNPTPSISGTKTICLGDSTLLSVTPAFSAYIWSTGQAQKDIFANAISVYKVTVTDANGCIGETSTNITQLTDLKPIISGKKAFCEGDTLQLTVNSGFGKYTWASGETTPKIVVNQAGIYKVTVNNGACKGVDSVVVIMNTKPIISISKDTVVCEGQEVALQANAGTAIYKWSNGDTTPFINVKQSGTYTVTVTTTSGCFSTKNVVVTSNLNPKPVINAPTTICSGQNVIIALTEKYSTYLWSTGQTTETIQINTAGKYAVTVSNSTGCSASVSQQIDVKSNLTPKILGKVKLCQGDSTTLSVDATFDNYKWSNGAITQSILVKTEGTYSVTVTSNAGCVGEAKVLVEKGNLTYSSKLEDIRCSGDKNGLIIVSPTNGTSPFSFNWSNGVKTGDNFNLTAGTYTVTINDAAGCSAIAPFEIIEPKPIKATIKGIAASCKDNGNGSISIEKVEGGVGNFSYSTDNQNFTSFSTYPYSIKNVAPGDYTLTIKDANKCSWSNKVKVLAGNAIKVDLGADITLTYGDSVVLTPKTDFQMTKIRWSPKVGLSCDTCQFTIAKPKATAVYKVTVTDENGCTATDDILLIINKIRRVYVPNAFSPNADGTNDLIRIYLGDETVKVNFFRIYNRWGSLVYEDLNFTRAESNDQKRGWDGFFKGEELNPAVFIYHAQVEFTDGEVKDYSGDIMLMKD
jgi:gliding motility-associated-like protein